MQISRDYDVLIEEAGISLRGLFIIDPKGIVRYAMMSTYVQSGSSRGSRQITVNDLPVGRSVDETIRLLQAFQFTVRLIILCVEPLVIQRYRTSTARSALSAGLKVTRRSRLTPRDLSTTSLRRMKMSRCRTALPRSVHAGPKLKMPSNDRATNHRS